jgi:aspartyl-tRNA(Asn)/glutamyl-tRNA(Gln) amidotransferase subunit A
MPADVPLTIAEAAAALRAGRLTSVALTGAVLARIEIYGAALGAYVTVCGPTAMAAARAADAELAGGRDLGPLHGIPLAVKDVVSTAEAPTTANSRVLDPGWGGGVDAPVVARLRRAGAVVVGKSTAAELSIGMPPDPELGFLVPRNPWNLAHTPSGSSSGSAIAVATGLALGGIGTDTAGAVRSPSAAIGQTGLKTTLGRVPTGGVVPLAPSLDTVGPIARTAEDCAALLGVIAGPVAGDHRTADVDVAPYSELLDGEVRDLRVGVPRPYFLDAPQLDPEVHDAVLAAVAELAGMGADVRPVEVPLAKQAKDAALLTMVAEAAALHRRHLVAGWRQLGRSTRTALARGALVTGADLVQAQRVRAAFRRRVAAVLRDVDVLVTPTALTPATLTAELDLGRLLDNPGFTAQWSLAGLPACAVPCGFSVAGLPLSLQVVGRPFAEGTVLRVADAYQRATDWHLRVPTLPAPARP